MTRIATDIVDVYVFRRLNARVQFFLLQRRNDVPMAQTWQAFHHEIADGQSAPEAAQAALANLAGLSIERYYSADFINQFYDEARDAVVLAPVLAVTISDQSSVTLAEDFETAGWFDRDEATARLPFSGQRWAVRHIDEIMSIGESEAELYRFEPTSPAPSRSEASEPAHEPISAPAAPPSSESGRESHVDVGLEPAPEEHDHLNSIDHASDTQSGVTDEDAPTETLPSQDRQD